MTKSRKYIWAILLFIYLGAVAYLCFMKPDDLPEVRPDIFGIPIDKIVHFLMFFPFPIVAYEAFKPKYHKLHIHITVLIILYAVGVGLAIGTEHIQGMLGYRSEDINDFYYDMAGMGCATLIMIIHILVKKLK